MKLTAWVLSAVFFFHNYSHGMASSLATKAFKTAGKDLARAKLRALKVNSDGIGSIETGQSLTHDETAILHDTNLQYEIEALGSLNKTPAWSAQQEKIDESKERNEDNQSEQDDDKYSFIMSLIPPLKHTVSLKK